MPKVHDYVTRMGLYGLDELALPILVGLVLNASILLVGRHGSGKTTLAHRLARALDLRFRGYDASTTPFEDILGFVDPASLSEGKARYVPTPLSALGAGLVFIDELSRGEPSMLNHFLELIFERSLLGEPLPDLQYVAAGMNPSTYLGASELDPALVGRFDVVLEVPDFATLSTQHQRAATEAAVGLTDGPGFGPSAGVEADGRMPDLVAFVERARAELPAVRSRHGHRVVDYTLDLGRALTADGQEFDGRRAGMVGRNLMAALAAREAGWPCPGGDEALFRRIVEASLPYRALDPDFESARVSCAHSLAWGRAGRPGALSAVDVLGDGNLDRAMDRYLQIAGQLDEASHDRIVQRFQEDLRCASLRARTEPALRLLRLLRAMQERHADYPPELVGRLMVWGRGFLGLERDCGEVLGAMASQAHDPIDLRRPEDALLARLALQLSLARPDDLAEAPDPARAASTLNHLRAGMQRSHGHRAQT
jgi:MoxR-like ATPase